MADSLVYGKEHSMNRNSDTERVQLDLGITEDLGNTARTDDFEPGTTGRDAFKSFWKPITGAGAGVLILIIVFVVWFKSYGENTDVELNTLKININILEGRLSQLENELLDLQAYVTSVKRSQGSISGKLNAVTAQVDQLEGKMASAVARPKIPDAVQSSQVAQSKGRYHEVRSGETLYRIAKAYGLSVDELCRLNDISLNQVGDIKPGLRLLVSSED
jgi:LysM repeat protein